MKILLSTGLFVMLFGLSSVVHAEWVPVENKMMCQTTPQAMEEFKQKSFQPLVVSQNSKGMVTVWSNNERAIIVTQSAGSYQDGITCMVIGGRPNSMWIEPAPLEDQSPHSPL